MSFVQYGFVRIMLMQHCCRYFLQLVYILCIVWAPLHSQIWKIFPHIWTPEYMQSAKLLFNLYQAQFHTTLSIYSF